MKLIALYTLGAAAIAAVASPATAAGNDRAVAVVPVAAVSACQTDPARNRCAAYQSRLLDGVATMTRQRKPQASEAYVGRQQLDALIASVN